MKKIIICVVAIFLVAGASFFAYQKFYEPKKITMYSQNANGDYVQLYEYIHADTVLSEHYGGCYINDAGQLVVCFTNDFFEIDFDYDNIMQMAHIIESVDFSFDELLNLQQEIHTTLFKMQEQYRDDENYKESVIFSVNGSSIYENINKLGISISSISEEKIAEFKEIFGDNNAFLFEEGYYNTAN